MSAIVCDRLSRRFGSSTAVDQLELSVEEGELFGLVGPDGAGKTTTLRMLAGVLRPSSGDATILGTSVSADPERIKTGIAYMPQRFGLYGDLTVAENLDFYADLYAVPEAERSPRLERLYRFSGLAPFRDRMAGDLSGGMKQKLALSCALIHRPRLLLLDEPTFGVDPISRRDLWLIVHEMVAEGMTAVVSTSYMDEAERFDRVALLSGGRLIRLGEPDDLKEQLGGSILAVAAADLHGASERASRIDWVVSAVLFGDRLHVRVEPGRDADDLLEALRAEGVDDATVTRTEASMEDVFIATSGAVT